MMKNVKLVVILLILPVSLYCRTDKDDILSTLNVLSDGLRNKDIETVRKTFAQDISISTGMRTGVDNFLEPILQNVNFESVELLSDSLDFDRDTVYVNVRFGLQYNKYQKSTIAFNSENKILFIDYFDRLFGQSRYNQSLLVGVIPFRLDDRSIILSVKLNDNNRSLSFLLDTGADGMAIRKSLVDSLGIKINYTQNANIVGGQTQVSVSSGNKVRLTDSLSLTGQNITIFDEIRHGLDGVIGLNLIKNYITKINPGEQKIYLYSFGDYRYTDDGITIPVKMLRSLIIIPSELSIAGEESITGNFLLDTGANYNLIAFSDFVRKNRLLETGFKPESRGTTVSLGHVTPVYHGKAHQFKIGDIVKNEIPVTLQTSTLNQLPRNDGIDGSIGIRFFINYNLTIDLLRKEIRLEPRVTSLSTG